MEDLILVPAPVRPTMWARLWSSPRAAAPSAVARGVVIVATLVGATAMTWSGVVHLKLWHEKNGYAQLPTVGKMFFLQGVGSIALAALAIALRRAAVAVLGVLLMASSIGGLLISLNGTLFGYHEYGDAPYVGASLVVEGTAVVMLGIAAGIALAGRRPTG